MLDKLFEGITKVANVLVIWCEFSLVFLVGLFLIPIGFVILVLIAVAPLHVLFTSLCNLSWSTLYVVFVLAVSALFVFYKNRYGKDWPVVRGPRVISQTRAESSSRSLLERFRNKSGGKS